MSELNHAAQDNFKVIFDKIPNVEFYTKSITLPTISVDQTDIAAPTFTLPLPGNKISYDPITLIYHLSENWENWIELYRWITGFANDNGFVSEENFQSPSNATVMALDNHNKEVFNLDFSGIFPINVESPTFDYATGQFTDIELSATFVIQGFNIGKNNE